MKIKAIKMLRFAYLVTTDKGEYIGDCIASNRAKGAQMAVLQVQVHHNVTGICRKLGRGKYAFTNLIKT